MDNAPARTDPWPPARRDDLPLLLTVSDFCQATRLGRSTVYRRLQDGRIRSVRVGASRRIPRQALDDFLVEIGADSPNPAA